MSLTIKINDIIKESIVDGPGFRYVLFLQGCHFNCSNCHNPTTHDVNAGTDYDLEELILDINSSKHIKGVTFSGGEPFLQVSKCLHIVNKLNKDLDVICYTGYTFEQLLKQSNENKDILSFLNSINYLIDGKYIDGLRSLGLKYRGSKNQRIIDVKRSLDSNQVVLASI